MKLDFSIECVADTKDTLGEGCFWDAVTESLWWLDIARPTRIHCLNPATGEKRAWKSSAMLTAMARRKNGGFILAGENGLCFFDDVTGKFAPFVQPEMNEAVLQDYYESLQNMLKDYEERHAAK